MYYAKLPLPLSKMYIFFFLKPPDENILYSVLYKSRGHSPTNWRQVSALFLFFKVLPKSEENG